MFSRRFRSGIGLRLRLLRRPRGRLVCSGFMLDLTTLTTLDVSPAGPWDAFTITDGRIVTGANPASAHVTAEAAVKAFDGL